MKRVIIVVVLVGIAAIAGLWRTSSRSTPPVNPAETSTASQSSGEPREEIRQSYQLSPDALVTISGINGRVDIKTSDTNTAEVYVLRTAGNRSSLDNRKVVIEQTSSSLVIRAENNASWWSRLWGKTAYEQVTLSAPRRIALLLKGINGRVNGGEVEGAVEIKGINGRVDVSQVKGSAKISGINGSILLGLRELNQTGVHASGINGSVEFRLPVGLNADLVANGMNGKVRSDIPEVSIDAGEYGSRYSARIGAGGAPIKVSGINGNVILTRLPLADVGDKPAAEKKSVVKANPAFSAG